MRPEQESIMSKDLLAILVHRSGGQIIVTQADYVQLPPGRLVVGQEVDGSLVLRYSVNKEAFGGIA